MKKMIIFGLLLITWGAFSQTQRTADRYFNKYAYVKSAELYEALVRKGNESKEVLSRLGDSYYFNLKTKKSETWYKKLFSLYEEEGIDPEYYYRLSQSLKSNGKYKEADTWLLKFRAIKKEDSRGSKIIKKTDYYTDYTNREGLYITVHNITANSRYSDYAAFSLNGEVYFSSTRPKGRFTPTELYSWNKQPYLNIYKGKEISFTNKKNKRALDMKSYKKVPGINSEYHDASPVVTKDGKTMYFTRDNFDGKKLKSDRKRTSHLKIFKASFEKGKWTNITELPFNDDAYSTGHPALSVDEKTLYFVSDMPGGLGQSDIYKVALLPDGTYGIPENLGKAINTEGKEMFPFATKEHLYFSSDGHLGLGALDVFRSSVINGNYSEPENMKAPINSAKDDFSFFLNPDTSSGYFSSNRSGGKGDDDIYSFVIYPCKEVISGIAYNTSDGSILPGVAVRLLDSEGKVIETVVADEKGVYDFTHVDCSRKYTIVGDLQNFTSDTDELETEDVDEKVIPSELFLKPLIIKDQIVINPIFFDFDDWKIRPDAEYELEKIVTVMKANPEIVIKIESHTDSRGNDSYNRELSDKRAKASRDYILSREIPASKIESAQGFGESRLLNHCNDANAGKCSKEEHQKNRRSYFYIISGKEKVRSSNE